jgi:hypothetical protein
VAERLSAVEEMQAAAHLEQQTVRWRKAHARREALNMPREALEHRGLDQRQVHADPQLAGLSRLSVGPLLNGKASGLGLRASGRRRVRDESRQLLKPLRHRHGNCR